MSMENADTTKGKINLIKDETSKIAASVRRLSAATCGLDSRENTICGGTLENIIDLMSEYERRNGKHPMSSESIRQAFRPDKISFGDSYLGPCSRQAAQKGLNDFYRRRVDSIRDKKVDSEIFAAKVQTELYQILPLKNVLAVYTGLILRQWDRVWMRGGASFLVDNRITISTHQGLTAKAAASKMALEIMRTHLYTWKAFAARVFQHSEDHLDVMYGVLEDKS